MAKHNVPLDDISLTVLVNTCAEIGCIEGAKMAVEKADQADFILNNIDCVQLIKAFEKGLHNYRKKSLAGVELLLKHMKKNSVKPDEVTYASLLKFCANSKHVELGQQLHEEIEKWLLH